MSTEDNNSLDNMDKALGREGRPFHGSKTAALNVLRGCDCEVVCLNVAIHS